MSDMCRCSYFVNDIPIINNKECPNFEQQDDEEFTMCSHVLIRDAKGYCEINFKGESNE
jgi:hypothetical protein